MNSHTGEYFKLPETLTGVEQIDAARQALGVEDPVILHGTDEAVAELSRRVKLGAAELDRRSKRRKQQAESRRRNRS